MDNSFEKLINRVLDSRYKIENVVGIGGMAYVLKAIDLKQDNRPVAIKILNQEFNGDENAVKRFVNESEAIAMVDSPNIVKIYDIAISDNLKYIVMEFIDGITLKDYMDKVGALGWKEAVHYVRQILRALAHAHEKGIIHRDIKPQNIMLLRDGKVKVTDFGIAKTPTSESLTMTDKAIGTVNYISPEQASGGKVDEKSDLYSVGVMLYEMLTGVLPFTAESPVAVAMMQVTDEPKSPREINPQIPVGLEQIVIKAMSKDPKDRFNSALSMERALEFFVKNPAVVFSGVSSTTGATPEAQNIRKQKDMEEKIQKSKQKHRSMFPIILGVTLSFFTVAILSVLIVIKSNSMTDGEENVSFFERISLVVDNMLGVGGNNSDDRKIVIENYIGKEYTASLRFELEEKGFEVVENRERTETDKKNNVILNQNPKSGEVKVDPKAGGKIKLVLYVNNLGADDDTQSKLMPDCKGMSPAAARSKILNKLSGLYITEDMLEFEEGYSEDVPKDKVFNTYPAPGSSIIDDIPEKIIIYVSKGPVPVEKKFPDVKGLTKDEVTELFESEGIKLQGFETEYSSSVEKGKATRASKKAGEKYMSDEDLDIVVYISEGPVGTMPNCVGNTFDKAKDKILKKFESLGITEDMIEYAEGYSDDVAKDKVYATLPAVGEVLQEDFSSKIVIYVSLGKEPSEAIMPEVLYGTLEDAERKLDEAGFKNVTIEYVNSTELYGTVVSVNYADGALISKNVYITLSVSNGFSADTDTSTEDELLELGGY